MRDNASKLKLLNRTLKTAKKSAFYRSKLADCPKIIKNINELQELPFTTKQELRDCYSFGALCVPMKDVIELHTSSGTTGKATLSYFTQKDLINSNKAISKAWQCFGVNENSRVQFMMGYGLFSGAAINTYAIQKLGGFVVPAGIQPTEKQVQMMLDFRVDTLVGTLGYYNHIFNYLQKHNIPIKRFHLKRGIAAGEIYSDRARTEIEKKFNIEIFDHYGLCEINTGIAYECKFRSGLHILDDYVLPEIIDPNTGKVLPPDQEGELVLTTLQKDASPVVRYRTGDITSIRSGRCRCGRHSIRIDRIKRRIDDLLFIKGIKIDPHELKDYVLEIANDQIYNDITIRLANDLNKNKPEILVSLKQATDLQILNHIGQSIKNKTLLNFKVINVDKNYFQRENNTKIKLVEYVNKKSNVAK